MQRAGAGKGGWRGPQKKGAGQLLFSLLQPFQLCLQKTAVDGWVVGANRKGNTRRLTPCQSPVTPLSPPRSPSSHPSPCTPTHLLGLALCPLPPSSSLAAESGWPTPSLDITNGNYIQLYFLTHLFGLALRLRLLLLLLQLSQVGQQLVQALGLLRGGQLPLIHVALDLALPTEAGRKGKGRGRGCKTAGSDTFFSDEDSFPSST